MGRREVARYEDESGVAGVRRVVSVGVRVESMDEGNAGIPSLLLRASIGVGGGGKQDMVEEGGLRASATTEKAGSPPGIEW
jgi:hypothetical protein